MGIVGEYARVSPAELDQVLADPEWGMDLVEELLDDDPAEDGADGDGAVGRRHDVDVAWDGLRFLLERAGFPVDLVRGERAVPGADAWGYGRPSYLAPERVRVAADALAGLAADGMVAGVAAADLAGARVYPENFWTEVDAIEYVTEKIPPLTGFLRAAADDGHAVLVWLS